MRRQDPSCRDIDSIYYKLIEEVLRYGSDRETRSGPCRAIFGASYQYDFQSDFGFPLISSKKINFNNIMHELNWFLRGESNIKTLKAPKLWEPWASSSGYVGPMYGEQWRSWPEYTGYGAHYIKHDQISNLIKDLKEDPYSRRHVVTAWNVSELEGMALAPCHGTFQCFVREGPGRGLLSRQQVQYLDLQLYQRSGDLAIGVPYNIASYGLLLKMLAQETNMIPGVLYHAFGDLHAYSDHIEGLGEQLKRAYTYASRPRLRLNPDKSFWEFVQEDDPLNYTLTDYDPAPHIPFKVHL